MPVKLILTDIDGTILPAGEHAVSPRTVAAFHAAIDAGMLVGPASGRGYAWIPPFFGDEACCAMALATNGLQVYLGGEKVLDRRSTRVRSSGCAPSRPRRRMPGLCASTARFRSWPRERATTSLGPFPPMPSGAWSWGASRTSPW